MSHSLGEEKDQLTQQFEERLNAKISSATGILYTGYAPET